LIEYSPSIKTEVQFLVESCPRLGFGNLSTYTHLESDREQKSTR